MRGWSGVIRLVVVGCLVSCANHGLAQQVTVGTPMQAIGDRFVESTGTQWGLQGRNWFFSLGGPFGGQIDGPSGGYFHGHAFQGIQRTFSSVTPFVTVTDGMPGYIADRSMTPFVVGFTPIVGGAPGLQDPLTLVGPSVPSASESIEPTDPSARKLAAARQSSAGRPAASVADARRLHEIDRAESNERALGYLDRARRAEVAGKPDLAKIYYRLAAGTADEAMRREVLARQSVGQGLP